MNDAIKLAIEALEDALYHGNQAFTDKVTAAIAALRAQPDPLKIIRADVRAAGFACGGIDKATDVFKEILWQVKERAQPNPSELVKDAARYRAIRNGLEVDPNNSGIVVSLIDDFGGETLRGEQADKAIDDAMAAIGGMK